MYSKIGSESFHERNGLAENVVVDKSVSVFAPVRMKVEFESCKLDVYELYDLFAGKKEFADLVEFCGKEKAVVDFDVIEAMGYVLSGDFEKDCISEGLNLKKISHTPYLDLLEKNLVEVIKSLHLRNGYPFARKVFPLSVCLTHDVDEKKKTYQYFTRACRSLTAGKVLDSLQEIFEFFHDRLTGRNPYWTFNELVQIEENFDVRSTFFFLEESAKLSANPKTWKHLGRRYRFDDEEVSNIIKFLREKGWEVALHGSYNSFKDLKLLKAEKERLESVLGESVLGIRQHNLNFDFPETWEIHERINLSYDTSLGFKSSRGFGFRWGTCKPFKPFSRDGRKIDVLEIPLTLMDVSIGDPERGLEYVENLFKEVSRVNGVFCVLWHHVMFNSREFPGWIELYRRLIELGKESNAVFLTAKEVDRLWRKMIDSPLKVSYGKGAAYSCDYPLVQVVECSN